MEYTAVILAAGNAGAMLANQLVQRWQNEEQVTHPKRKAAIPFRPLLAHFSVARSSDLSRETPIPKCGMKIPNF